MIVRNGMKPVFDVRTMKSLAYDGPDNDMIEAAYDTVNRMVILIGDIPFKTLFTSPWIQLSLSCRIQDAEAAGLLNDPEAVWNAFDVLEASGRMSWSSYINGDVYREGDDEISLAHRALDRQGIFLPHLRGRTSTNKKVMTTLNTLIEKAPELTYFHVLTQSIGNLEALDAVRDAVKLAIIMIPANHKCCSFDTITCIPGLPMQTCYSCTGGSGSSMC